MLRTNDRESEILLGNKQLLGIFFAVALLLGVAFYGGYMFGRGSSGKKVVASNAETPTVATSSSKSVAAGETHTVSAEGGSDDSRPMAEGKPVIKSNPGSHELSGAGGSEVPLGTRKSKVDSQRQTSASPLTASETISAGYAPQPGSEYLQVVAIARGEAVGLADVLHKKGFRAHAVPKPGNSELYRVIVGPIRDAGDLSSTREALRKTGFREVIVQRY